MNFLDAALILLWLLAWVWGFLSGSDSLYKLFLGIIIAFLSYLVISTQIELISYIPQEELNSYQNFLHKNDTRLLSIALFMIPILWIFFMLHPRLQLITYKNSPSQLLLGLILPAFLVGILAHLAWWSILSESESWRKVFDFFSWSVLYKTFFKLPWVIFLLLVFLIFYKSIFLLFLAFISWLWKHVILQFFRSWNEEKRLKNSSTDIVEHEQDELEE